jgi:GNAT superfamily N-acetyltransferase
VGPSPISVVRLVPDEWERLRAVRVRALRDAPDAFTSTLAEAEARSPRGWTHQLEDLPTWIAVIDGADVGMVRGSNDDDREATVWLISMWVAPEARRRGVGGRLIDAVVDWARAGGARRVLLEVADWNTAAAALYERKGFKANGRSNMLPAPRDHIREHQRELRLA